MERIYGLPMGLPPDASAHGLELDKLTSLVHWFMLVLFVGWGLFFVYCLFRFRRKGRKYANCMTFTSRKKFRRLSLLFHFAAGCVAGRRSAVTSSTCRSPKIARYFSDPCGLNQKTIFSFSPSLTPSPA